MANSDDYDPKDFGADHIVSQENWRDSGYTHYTAYNENGGQVSWNEAEYTDRNGQDYRQVVDIHISSLNDRRR